MTSHGQRQDSARRAAETAESLERGDTSMHTARELGRALRGPCQRDGTTTGMRGASVVPTGLPVESQFSTLATGVFRTSADKVGIRPLLPNGREPVNMER